VYSDWEDVTSFGRAFQVWASNRESTATDVGLLKLIIEQEDCIMTHHTLQETNHWFSARKTGGAMPESLNQQSLFH